MTVQFSGVDWGQEQCKAEVRVQKRKLHIQKKKNEKLEEELLRRFRRFLNGMAQDELSRQLTPQHVFNSYPDRDDGMAQEKLSRQLTPHRVSYFYPGRDEDYVRNRTRLIADLASDEMLDNRRARPALALLRLDFVEMGHFGEADDFLESLFAFSAADLQALVESQSGIFRGPLELLYRTGDDAKIRRLFLRRNHLRVGHLGEECAGAVLELRRLLIDGNFVAREADGTVSSLGTSRSSERGDVGNRRWWQLWRPRRRQGRQKS